MDQLNLPMLKYATYEIQMLATDTGPQFNFPVNNYLTGRRVFAMEVFSSKDIDRSPISTGYLAWSPANMLQATVTLNLFDPTLSPGTPGSKGEWIKQLPVNALHRLFNTNSTDAGASVYHKMLMGGLEIDFNNSFITFTQPLALAANTAALFGVYYK